MKAALPRIVLTFLLSCLLTTGIGCTRESPKAPDKPSFAFDWKHTESLTLVKADPRTGDHWMARVERQQERPQDFYENDSWLIKGYSENGALLDRLANRNYILHLLDTLGTFRPTALVSQDGRSETVRASYGLLSPRYSLEWTAWDEATGKTQTFRVEIGNPVDPDHPASAESYGVFPPSHAIYKVDGAAIAMLDYLKTFQTFRQETLSPLSSDDIDEFEIRRGGRKVFYAQREGDGWTNEKHKPWKKDVAAFVDRITHLRIQTFLDSPTAAAAARADLEHHPLEEIIVKTRDGKPTEFRFALVGQKALASVSSRDPGVFELYPGALTQQAPR